MIDAHSKMRYYGDERAERVHACELLLHAIRVRMHGVVAWIPAANAATKFLCAYVVHPMHDKHNAAFLPFSTVQHLSTIEIWLFVEHKQGTNGRLRDVGIIWRIASTGCPQAVYRLIYPA